jgi:hypothetical protein
MSSMTPPDFDRAARTVFLKRTIARAMTPRARNRVHALRELERLIAIKADGGSLGVRGHLLASIARDYPVSCEDPEVQAKAEDVFFERTSWEPRHLLGMAIGISRHAQAHEERIIDLERRRRALLKDYREMKAIPRVDIEDAEIVG